MAHFKWGLYSKKLKLYFSGNKTGSAPNSPSPGRNSLGNDSSTSDLVRNTYAGNAPTLVDPLARGRKNHGNFFKII
jgi:hypothetical protein